MQIIDATNESFNNLINEELVLVDFYANWCGPCKMLAPVLENLASSRSNMKIIKVDVDKCDIIARNLGVMSIPTLMLFQNGRLISTKVGFMPETEIMNWVEGEK